MSLTMDNSGAGQLRVPGYGGIPIDYQLKPQHRFAHGFEEFRQTPAITARELAMTEAMNFITEKHRWYERIFDDSTATAWAREVKVRDKLVGKKAWRWCLAELRDKATQYRQDRFVQVFDTGSCVCKSRELVPPSVAANLKSSLASSFAARPPKRSLFTAVDPDFYPLAYKKSHVLESGGRVKLSEFSSRDIQSSGDAIENEKQGAHQDDDLDHNGEEVSNEYDSETSDEFSSSEDRHLQNKNLYSFKYQRLPCDLEFIGSGTDVRITSYINNVHPSNRLFYESVEKLVSYSIPMWNSCLVKATESRSKDSDEFGTSRHGNGDQTQEGRIPLRIISFGAVWKNDLNLAAMYRDKDFIAGANAVKLAKQSLENNSQQLIDVDERRYTPGVALHEWGWIDKAPPFDDTSGLPDYGDPENVGWSHPQPGESFSYAEWKAGKHTDEAVVDMIMQSPGYDYVRKRPTHTRYEVELEKTFRASGLQVIVQVRGDHFSDSILRESGEHWRVEGVLNEHIVATTIYAYDVENCSGSIDFRQETSINAGAYRYQAGRGPSWCQQDDSSKIRWRRHCHCNEARAMAEIYGFDPQCLDPCLNNGSKEGYQYTGEVGLRQGTIVTFPNVLEHRVGMKRGQGKGMGHFRYIALHLVDPNYRICSTKNVPPQQYHWWGHAATDLLKRKGLPQELIDSILDASRSTLSEEQADDRRAEIIIECDKMSREREARIRRIWF